MKLIRNGSLVQFVYTDPVMSTDTAYKVTYGMLLIFTKLLEDLLCVKEMAGNTKAELKNGEIGAISQMEKSGV